MFEHFFYCPYCWEKISFLIEEIDGLNDYIEDCEVCCRSINVIIEFKNNELVSFKSMSTEE